MQLFSHDQILEEIHKLFDWNPPSLSPDPSARPKLIPPSTFYYHHLDSRLSLRETVLMPDLVPNLSLTADRILKDIKEREIILPPVLVGDMFPSVSFREGHIYNDPITDAYSVAQAYQRTTGHHCRLVSSMLYLSPRSPSWRGFCVWGLVEPGSKANPGLDETRALHLKHHLDNGRAVITDDIWDSLEEETRSTLRRVIQQSPVLALWEIFADTLHNAELLRGLGIPRVVKPLGSAAAIKNVQLLVDLSHKRDAINLSWGSSMTSLSGGAPQAVNSNALDAEGPKGPPQQGPRSRKGVAENITNRSKDHAQTVTLPERAGSSGESLSEVVLKCAWLRAIHNDSTFVIFNCGKFERIAFRHRGSQKLYMSDLIEVTHCKNPGYGKLHIGLYISIMHDILDRMRQHPKEDVTQGKKRRRAEHVPVPKYKRPRTRALIAKLEADDIEHEKACDYLTSDATRCDLLLISMYYGVYNSPSPSFFLRSGRSQKGSSAFAPHEYISVILTSDIAAGATGVVHGATLKFLSDGGSSCSMSVVVKFSMKRDQQKRLRHEHSIYEHLTLSRLKGIPRIIGLFEDHNSDMLALVMTHTGTSLSNLYSEEAQFMVEEPQRSAFLRTMSDVHAAGVRHRDIRPENLTVDDEGRVFIIDFDMAEISPTEGAKSRELSHMTELLNGHYSPPNEFPSERTNPRSESSSSSSGLSTEQE